jgi:hypothetical protein
VERVEAWTPQTAAWFAQNCADTVARYTDTVARYTDAARSAAARSAAARSAAARSAADAYADADANERTRQMHVLLQIFNGEIDVTCT